MYVLWQHFSCWGKGDYQNQFYFLVFSHSFPFEHYTLVSVWPCPLLMDKCPDKEILTTLIRWLTQFIREKMFVLFSLSNYSYQGSRFYWRKKFRGFWRKLKDCAKFQSKIMGVQFINNTKQIFNNAFFIIFKISSQVWNLYRCLTLFIILMSISLVIQFNSNEWDN